MKKRSSIPQWNSCMESREAALNPKFSKRHHISVDAYIIKVQFLILNVIK